MVGQRRAPGVQHGGEADARAQMLRVGGDGGQRLRCGPEQEVVDGRLVLERDGADRGRQGEDDVIVGNRQELRLAIFEPSPRGGRLALRAVAIPAGNGLRGPWREPAGCRVLSKGDRVHQGASRRLRPQLRGRVRQARGSARPASLKDRCRSRSVRAPPTAPSQTVIKPPRICPEITRPGLQNNGRSSALGAARPGPSGR